MTTNYNYREAVTADIIDYIRDNITTADFTDREDFTEWLHDDLWTADNVTGNASGSYTFNSYKAKEYIFSDPDTVAEALREFCVEAEAIAEHFLNTDWEYFDVTTRCYLLGECIESALDFLDESGELIFSDDEE